MSESGAYTVAQLQPELAKDLAWSVRKSNARHHGSHVLNLLRPSRMPMQSRSYVPGDPVHLIDWRAFARTDQLIIRQQRDAACARICIDISAAESMFWPDDDTRKLQGLVGPTKFEIAARIGLHIAHLYLRSGDLVFVRIVGDLAHPQRYRAIPSTQAFDIVQSFEHLSGQNFTAASVGSMLYGRDIPSPGPCDLHYVLTDAISDQHLHEMDAFERARLIFFHTLSTYEVGCQWTRGAFSYFDGTPPNTELLGRDLNEGSAYDTALNGWIKGLQEDVRARGGEFYGVNEHTSVNAYLRMIMPEQQR